MKIGCCLNMVATRSDGTGVELISAAKSVGFDYLELPLAEMMTTSDSVREEIRQSLKQNNISCEACNNFFPKTFRLTGDSVDTNGVMDYVNKAFEFASSLGVKRVVFGSGPAKNVPDGFPMERGYGQVVELLKSVAPIAEKNNLIVAIEPLRQAECNLINTFEDGVRLAKDVNSEHVKVLVDFYHLTEESEPVSHLLEYGKANLRHVHFAKPQGRVYPVGFADADYTPFIQALKEIGYDERISLEAYSKNFTEDAKTAVRFMQEQFS